MTITLMNPAGLPTVETHHQLSIATGSRLVFLAGQVAWDVNGDIVGEGDLAAQVEQCYLNIATALTEVSGSFDDIAKLSIFVVDLKPEHMSQLGEGINRAAARLDIEPAAPITGLGVSSLAEPELLVEVEAIAVID